MRVRIKQIIDRYGKMRYAVQYHKWFFWKTFDDYSYRHFNDAIAIANKLKTWNKTYYTWPEKKENK